MSYIRYNSPLKYFKGFSSGYVFPTSRKIDEDEYDNYVEDYDNKYDDKLTLIDLVCRIIQMQTDDEVYAFKMARVLAKHMGVSDKLRHHPLTNEEWSKETHQFQTKLTEDPSYRQFIESVSKHSK